MRIDDFLSTVGIIKRRTIAKEMASNGLIEVNGRKIKAAYNVSVGDIIRLKGSHPAAYETLALPLGSVPKTERESYYRELSLTD